MVVNELRGEKIDIVSWSEDPAQFVAEALSPAKVKSVQIDEQERTAHVVVPDYQLSLAIGKEGQNARLAARLTGWRIDIVSESQAAEQASQARGADRDRRQAGCGRWRRWECARGQRVLRVMRRVWALQGETSERQGDAAADVRGVPDDDREAYPPSDRAVARRDGLLRPDREGGRSWCLPVRAA